MNHHVILGLAFLVVGLGILSHVYFTSGLHLEILFPAYLSVRLGCEPTNETLSSVREAGFEIGGYTLVQYENNTLSNVTIVLMENADPATEKHERCHESQARRNALYSCDQRVLRYFNEVECYVRQRF